MAEKRPASKKAVGKRSTSKPRTEATPAAKAQLASLRQFIRTRGEDYLRDPNISSIGIGYKIIDGKQTTDLSVQFTVYDKLEGPEALALSNSALIPESITIDGVEVPTDVLQRGYEPSFQVVAEADIAERKIRIDPVVPGVSIGNIHISAGTLGAIVYDRADGSPYVLSNWHVLHGPDGAIGDIVVQPGAHDDNRTDRNHLGTLARSHLGIAGDCAVATIVDRRFADQALEFEVSPRQLGEPELGDVVVKSGRTTGVTWGVVRRIDTIAEINYGGKVGVKNIGCFEIGPDGDHPAEGEEISRGGDSGALWLFARNGQPTDVVAGLHFGGETDNSPDEHALACLAGSVFEKLNIGLEPPVAADRQAVEGFDTSFLSVPVPLPTLDPSVADDIVTTVDGDTVVNHTHFSLQMRMSRRFAFWVAWNIDGGSLKALSRHNIRFVNDPQVSADSQVGDELYADNDLDRGHLARRADLLWGALPIAKKANTDSFYFTNITPQINDFNQSRRDGLWGQLEDAVFADVDVDDLKVDVFAGPVFQSDDRLYRDVRLPREFWKIIVFVESGTLHARAFLLTQNLNQLEALELDEFRVYQVAINEVEKRTGVIFPSELHTADNHVATEALDHRQPLRSLEQIAW